jgi:hypothetical protein
MTDRTYRFNGTHFAFELFEDEVVILNVTEGSYFALGGWAFDVWLALADRHPLGRLADAIAGRYGVPADEIADELSNLAAKLVQEGILLEADPAEEVATLSEPPAGGFRPLVFEKHVDMEDLMTLDPIHDVDPEQGWPKYRTKS